MDSYLSYLKKIWECSSDYILSLSNDEFAKISGGSDRLLSLLKIAVNEYETREEDNQ